jgi:hypothetical protein
VSRVSLTTGSLVLLIVLLVSTRLQGEPVCKGMVCGGRCRPKVYGCSVLVRCQMGDRCNPIPAALGCGPMDPGPDTSRCDVGVVNHELVFARRDCTPARFRRVIDEGCRAYRRKNTGKPLDEYDPSREIPLTIAVLHFDHHGNLIDGPPLAHSQCPPPPAGRP